jgi:hypothetical protein
VNVTVKVRCIYCRKTKNLGPGEVPAGDVPMCDCGGVMVAESASAKRRS